MKKRVNRLDSVDFKKKYVIIFYIKYVDKKYDFIRFIDRELVVGGN